MRRHAVDVRARSVAASAAHFESRRAAVVPEREDVGETRRLDARQLGQALDQLLAQRQSSVNGVAAGVHVDAGDQPSLDVESRVHRGDPHETSQHQRRQDQQNEARRDLADDESVAQAQPPRDAKTRAALHDGRDVAPGRLQGWRKPAQQAGEGEQPDRVDGHRDRRLEAQRDRPRPRDREHAERAHQPDRQQGAGDRARRGKAEAFDQEQTDDLQTAGAERDTNRDLALTARRARQQQSGHVGAGAQEHEAKQREEHRGPDQLSRGVRQFASSQAEHARRAAHVRVVHRVGLFELTPQRRQCLLCLLASRPGVKPGQHVQRVAIVPAVHRRQDKGADRDVEVGVFDHLHRFV